MKRGLVSIAATLVVGLAAIIGANAAELSNPISISESFDAAPVDGTAYTVSGKGYEWNVIATDFFGTQTGGKRITSESPLLSLTANSGRDILTITNGAGGIDRDVEVTFGAGVSYGFGQTAEHWYMTFTSSDDKELFKLGFRNGGNIIQTSLIVGDETRDTDYTFTNAALTTVSAHIAFDENGGTVTYGNVSLPFTEGGDIAKVTVSRTGVSDQSRPFVIDDFNLKTLGKQLVSITVVPSDTENTAEGAVLTVDGTDYTLDDTGVFEKYYLPGEYSYKVRLSGNEPQSGKITVVSVNDTTYTFSGITAEKPVLIAATYEDGVLAGVTTQEIEPQEDGTYTAVCAGATDKLFLWESLESLKPAGTVETTKLTPKQEITVTMNALDAVKAEHIEITNGDEYIYLPASGTAKSFKYSTIILDNSELEMQSAIIDWTLPNETSDKISISNGIVTLDAEYPIENDAGKNITVRATVHGTEVYDETTLHINNVSRVTDWDIVGAAAVKNGISYTYRIENIKDQYGNGYTGATAFTLTADKTAAIDGLTITPNTTTETEEPLTLTFTLNGTETKKTKTATAYAYDFYEPGVNEASYGEPRMETVNGVKAIVWPSSLSAKAVTEIELPEPVTLTPGSEKVITFDNIATNKMVVSQERSLQFVSSGGINVLNIDFGGANTSEGRVFKDWVKSTMYYGTEIGQFALNTKASAEFVLKTDADGVTTAILTYNGTETEEFEVGVLGDIAKIQLASETGAPDDRLLTLTNIKIVEREPSAVEIHGGNTIARVYGAVARKQYTAKIYDKADGEQFVWSVTDSEGNAIPSVSISQDGILSVKPEVSAPQTAVITYASKTDADKKAAKEITIADYASTASFDITGEIYIPLNDGSADYPHPSYAVENIIDEYGDIADMQYGFAITTGRTLATINHRGQTTIAANKTGTFTVTAAVGNPNRTIERDLKVTIAKYAEIGDADGDSREIDVTALANYAEDTRYLVTTALNDGTLVNQEEMTAEDGTLTIDTTGADKYEVSPIFEYTDVGDVSEGLTVPICNGTYDFTFKKSNGTRGDIYVNGIMVGQNVDQNGVDRETSGAEFEAKDIIVTGGKAVVVMKDNSSDMDTVTVKKTPEIVNRKTHIYIMGDSLAAAYYGGYTYTDGNGTPLYGTGQTGWGETLGKYLTDDVIITNLAEGGSGAYALYQSTFPSIVQNARPGDYFIMECGYQDEVNGGESMMRMALNAMAKKCSEKNVEMIIVTPNCGSHGTTNMPEIRLGGAALEVAEDNGILGINLSGTEYPYLEEVGEDYWARNFNLAVPESDILIDKLHSSYMGAMLHAKYIAQAIYDAQQGGAYGTRLDGIPVNTSASYTMKDSNGDDYTFDLTE